MPDYTTDYQPLTNTGFNRKYIINGRGIDQIKEKMCDQTFWQDFSLLFSNPSDYVNSIKYYPFDINQFAELTPNAVFSLGKTLMREVECKNMYNVPRAKRIWAGTINRYFNNFMDFEPYTKMELHIPYFDTIALPVNELMGQYVFIDLSIDFDTGIGTLYIFAGQPLPHLVMKTSAKLGIDIPIGATNLNEIAKENSANVMKTIAGVTMIAVGGAYGKTAGGLLLAKGLSSALTSGIDIVNNQQVRYQRGSTSGGLDMLGDNRTLSFIITRPNPVPIDSEYNHIKGKPLGEIKVLSQLRGFTIVDQIHLQSMPNALDEEMKEIESLLKSGVEL